MSNLLILSTSLYTIDLDIGFQNILFKNGFLPTSHIACIITNYSNLRKIDHFWVLSLHIYILRNTTKTNVN